MNSKQAQACRLVLLSVKIFPRAAAFRNIMRLIVEFARDTRCCFDTHCIQMASQPVLMRKLGRRHCAILVADRYRHASGTVEVYSTGPRKDDWKHVTTVRARSQVFVAHPRQPLLFFVRLFDVLVVDALTKEIFCFQQANVLEIVFDTHGDRWAAIGREGMCVLRGWREEERIVGFFTCAAFHDGQLYASRLGAYDRCHIMLSAAGRAPVDEKVSFDRVSHLAFDAGSGRLLCLANRVCLVPFDRANRPRPLSMLGQFIRLWSSPDDGRACVMEAHWPYIRRGGWTARRPCSSATGTRADTSTPSWDAACSSTTRSSG